MKILKKLFILCLLSIGVISCGNQTLWSALNPPPVFYNTPYNNINYGSVSPMLSNNASISSLSHPMPTLTPIPTRTPYDYIAPTPTPIPTRTQYTAPYYNEPIIYDAPTAPPTQSRYDTPY